MIYVVRCDGDLSMRKGLEEFNFFTSLEKALLFIKDSVYPYFDIEDDRVLVWEVDVESNKFKVVWHCCGWHWPCEYGIPTGTLPGHKYDMYTMLDSDGDQEAMA